MNRTLRNGLAVAGMAGGIFFLGQAVASADVNQDNTAPAGQSQVNGDGGENSADIDQSNRSTIHQDATGGNAGVGVLIVNGVGGNEVNGAPAAPYTEGPSTAGVNQGPPPRHEDEGSTTVRVSFDTHIANNVAVDSTINNSANGTISDSPDVNQRNSAPVSQTSTNEQERGRGGPPHNNNQQNALFGPFMPGGGGGDNDLDVDQHNSSHIDQDATGGDVGVGVGIVNLVGGNTVNCWGEDDAKVVCDVSFNTTINNNVDIHSIICGSGNGTIGTLPAFVCGSAPAAPATPAPVQQAKPAAHNVKTAAAAKKASAGKGELAFTGAETSAPLTFGLLALGAGGALTLAGRRRNTTTV
jgi:hypothetical protein